LSDHLQTTNGFKKADYQRRQAEINDPVGCDGVKLKNSCSPISVHFGFARFGFRE
jgi:hypothetical protein